MPWVLGRVWRLSLGNLKGEFFEAECKDKAFC